MTCSKTRVCTGILGTLGAGILVLGIISIPVLPKIVELQVAKNVMLKEGSQTYQQWKEPTVDIYLQVYVFNVDNPDQVLEGHRPVLTERGPYTYKEHRKKVDIIHYDNGTVSYRQIKTYFFHRNMSVGPDSDKFTTINIPLMVLVNALNWEGGLIQWLASILGSLLGENSFVHKSVRDIVWGYQDPLMHAGMVFDPSRFYTDIMGVLAGKNNTDDGTYTVYTGERDISDVGTIDRYNGSSELPFWTTSYANMVNGTDGSVCRPFVHKDTILRMFSTDICRSVYGIYNGSMTSPQGIEMYRYSAPIGALANPSTNPDNIGFCTPAGHCMGTGVLNLTTCQVVDSLHVPIIASFPHFYLADKKYQKAVIGLHPDHVQHATNVDIEPTTGLVMQIAKRLQINMFIEKSHHIKELKNIPSMVFPLLWINESAKIDDADAYKVKTQLLLPLQLIYKVQYVVIVAGSLILLAVVVNSVRISRRNKQASANLKLPIDDVTVDTAPLLSDNDVNNGEHVTNGNIRNA